MHITRIICRHVRIPLKRKVKHASHERTSTDSLVVSCELSDGTIGWGEGVPREYVTGDTIESCLQLFSTTAWSELLAGELDSPASTIERTQQIQFPAGVTGVRNAFGNPLRCGLELAMLDAVSQSLQCPLSEFIASIPETQSVLQQSSLVRYSGILASSTIKKIKWLSRIYRVMGFRTCKLKLGFQNVDDRELLTTARRYLGPKVKLRIDANEGWSPAELIEKDRLLQEFDVVAMEQPLRQEDVDSLSDLRSHLTTPVMLDESLCSQEDAEIAIQRGLCDLFNIRLSKCGGLLSSVKLASIAHAAGLGYQLGSQVGETGILSAAGRHFATNIGGCLAVEGSFDNFLVHERLTREDVTFWINGTGRPMKGFGLGITIDPQAISRVTIREIPFMLDQ